MGEAGEKKYYRIRAGFFWLLAGGMVLLLLGAYFKDELYGKWLKSGGMEDVTYEGRSRLENAEACYLCGNSDDSMAGYYRKSEGIGLISLNDWYVLDFRLKYQDENEVDTGNGTSSTFGNTGEITYSSESYFQGAMASMKVTLPEEYGLNMEMLEEHLCQTCLNKVLEALEFRKWKHEKKAC